MKDKPDFENSFGSGTFVGEFEQGQRVTDGGVVLVCTGRIGATMVPVQALPDKGELLTNEPENKRNYLEQGSVIHGVVYGPDGEIIESEFAKSGEQSFAIMFQSAQQRLDLIESVLAQMLDSERLVLVMHLINAMGSQFVRSDNPQTAIQSITIDANAAIGNYINEENARTGETRMAAPSAELLDQLFKRKEE